MSLGLIGKKIGMTRIFNEAGAVIPVTVIQAGPCAILQVKRDATDGYGALQLGFEAKPEKKSNKAEAGHLKKSGSTPVRVVREFRTDKPDEYEVGKSLAADIFQPGEIVDVIGVSKGRGFGGPVKRHHTKGGPETHGSMYHRRVGSMGGSSDPSRVWKGKKLAGHMGAKRKTAQNIEVVKVDAANNLVVVRGSIPGHINSYVMIAKSKKKAIKAAKKKA